MAKKSSLPKSSVTSSPSAPRFEAAPKELIAAIEDGKCVAFIGAGLSKGAGFDDWKTLLSRLAAICETGNYAEANRIASIRKLIASMDTTKFLMAAEDLRDCLGPDLFISQLADIFQDKTKSPTETHRELPKIPFRAVLTTNYDKLIEYAYGKHLEGRTPLTLTCNDSADLADALFKDKFFILKAHGDVEKRSTLVITEKDYREIFYKRPGYKIALSTVFTTKSVLFLGASLGDPELWLMLGYLHDCFHGSGTYHYALVPRGDESATMFNRWRNDFQVRCIHYDASPGHDEVLEFLKTLPHS